MGMKLRSAYNKLCWRSTKHNINDSEMCDSKSSNGDKLEAYGGFAGGVLLSQVTNLTALRAWLEI